MQVMCITLSKKKPHKTFNKLEKLDQVHGELTVQNETKFVCCNYFNCNSKNKSCLASLGPCPKRPS
jgi:hypothetical protein